MLIKPGDHVIVRILIWDDDEPDPIDEFWERAVIGRDFYARPLHAPRVPFRDNSTGRFLLPSGYRKEWDLLQ